MDKVFGDKRYMTKGIDHDIPLELQSSLWKYIDKLKEQGIQLDYLQVFELRKISNASSFNQEVVHSQEIPLYRKNYLLTSDKPIDTRVYVIDDSEQSVMMLSSEY